MKRNAKRMKAKPILGWGHVDMRNRICCAYINSPKRVAVSYLHGTNERLIRIKISEA